MQTWTFSGNSLHILEGDITRADTRAIVNAANPRLAGGGGVDGAIQRAAGPRLLLTGQDLVRVHGMVSPGDAVITPAFDLPHDYVIHAVGPIWNGGEDNEARLLESAYTVSLLLARAHTIPSLAFPAISCGAYGYPVEQAAPIALRTLAEGLEEGLVQSVQLILHGADACHHWQEQARKLL